MCAYNIHLIWNLCAEGMLGGNEKQIQDSMFYVPSGRCFCLLWCSWGCSWVSSGCFIFFNSAFIFIGPGFPKLLGNMSFVKYLYFFQYDITKGWKYPVTKRKGEYMVLNISLVCHGNLENICIHCSFFCSFAFNYPHLFLMKHKLWFHNILW